MEKRVYKGSENELILQEITDINRMNILNKAYLKNGTKCSDYQIQGLRKIKKRFYKYWNCTQDEVCSDFFTTSPIITYSKLRDIEDVNIRSQLKVNITPKHYLRLKYL